MPEITQQTTTKIMNKIPARRSYKRKKPYPEPMDGSYHTLPVISVIRRGTILIIAPQRNSNTYKLMTISS